MGSSEDSGELSSIRSYKVNHDVQIDILPSLNTPPRAIGAKVNALWQAAIADEDTHVFNGTILSVIDVGSDRIEVAKSDYRSYYAQTKDPSLFEDLQIRPLACSGLTRCNDGYVLARRSDTVFLEPGHWELAPSGTFDAQSIDENEAVDPGHFIQRELHEELGIPPEQSKTGRIVGIFEHLESHTIDIAIEIDVQLSITEFKQFTDQNKNDEYSEFAVVDRHQLREFVGKIGSQLVPTSLKILDHLKLI